MASRNIAEKVHDLEEIVDPRLTRKLMRLTGVTEPRLYAPPPDTAAPGDPVRRIGVWRFPEWMLVQEKDTGGRGRRERRLVHRKELDDRGRFQEDKLPVVPTRFVRAACSRGHVADLNWRWFVHQGKDPECRRRLWLVERGTGGDLGDLEVRCECGSRRGMHEAADPDALGPCWGARPWLGAGAQEQCGLPSRLLIRTAANAYFAQTLSALSLPEHGSRGPGAVRERLGGPFDRR